MSDQESINEMDTQTGETNNQLVVENKNDTKSDTWFKQRNTAEKVLIVLGCLFLGLIFLALVGLVTMKLWNALLPEIFGIKSISYWQAWGLLLLSCIFFRSWGGSGESGRKKRKKNKNRECC